MTNEETTFNLETLHQPSRSQSQSWSEFWDRNRDNFMIATGFTAIAVGGWFAYRYFYPESCSDGNLDLDLASFENFAKESPEF